MLVDEPLQEHHYYKEKVSGKAKAKKISFGFRRVYNLKIAWEVELDEEGDKEYCSSLVADAPLQEFTYKKEKKHITSEELAHLEDQILRL